MSMESSSSSANSSDDDYSDTESDVSMSPLPLSASSETHSSPYASENSPSPLRSFSPPSPPPLASQDAHTTPDAPSPRQNFHEGNSGPPPEPKSDFHRKYYPGMDKRGTTYGKAKNSMEELFDNDVFAEDRKKNRFYPFCNAMEWEVASWLQKLHAPVELLDQFFKLKYVSSRPFSFSSGNELRSRIDLLPKPPSWESEEVEVEGGTTKRKIIFYHRKGLPCFKFLVGNPVFREHSEYVAHETFSDESMQSKVYGSGLSGSWAFEMQKKIGIGQTIGLVILGSDKTQLSTQGGHKECHALYLSSGNIQNTIRSKLGARCWLMVGQIPVVKFKEKKFQSLLSMRLFHKCLDIVCEDLKACAVVPELFPDAFGELRLWRTFLAAHMGDLVELWVVTGTAQNYSPHSLCYLKNFGDPRPKQPRTGDFILRQIENLVKAYDPLDLHLFETKSKSVGFNGVHEPYWRDWEFADPSQFLSIDILHGVKRFVGDHPVKWMVELLGEEEIDRRYAALQRIVGRKHFEEGFTKYKQRTHKEQSDILRNLVAVSKDAPNVHRGIMKCIRALADFFYVAQYEYHDEETIGYLESYLKTFHDYKEAFVAAEVRDGWRIPKLEGFQHFPRKIRLTGSLNQYSTETTERLHITSAKQPYRHTNRKDFQSQMCRFLDRDEQVALFWTQLHWLDLMDGVRLRLAEELHSDEDPEPDEVQKATELAMRDLAVMVLPKPTKDIFSRKNAIKTGTTAFKVTNRAHWRNAILSDVAAKIRIPDLEDAIERYFLGHAGIFLETLPRLHFSSVDIWNYVSLQLKTVQDDKILIPPQTVMAAPPSESSPLGWCNFVLFRDRSKLNHVGIRRCGDEAVSYSVAQLRLIFKARLRGRQHPNGESNDILVYLQPFKPAPGSVINRYSTGEGRAHVPDKDIEMFRVVRQLDREGVRKGLIVKLTDIWRYVELVPRFGKECDVGWNSENACELATEFYLNSFADKHIYQSVY